MISITETLDIHFPLELKPRTQQIEMLNLTKESVNNGKKFILLNAPTGSGKSYFTMMFMNWYKNFVNDTAKFDIITNSKILQQQYKDDFDFICDLRGQSNYDCDRHKTNCHLGKEMNKALKLPPCGNCPYDSDKKFWIGGEISLTNFHLFNSFAFYVPEIMEERHANVLIVDEAHSFEEVFCDFISIKLSARIFKNYGIEEKNVDRFVARLGRIQTIKQYINFVNDEFLPHISSLKDEFDIAIGEMTNDKIKETYAKYVSYIDSATERFESLLDDFEKHEENWVVDSTKDKNLNIELTVQPIWGHLYLNEAIWDKYDHVIFMSGTILDKKMFSYLNGFDEELTDYYDLNSTFPILNRPLYYIPTGKMTYTEKEVTFQKQIKIISKILKKYEKEKGIIHTTNYELSNWINKSIKDKRFVFHDSENREDQFEKFKKKNKGIMVSPSMISGISLDDDMSRFQIMMKVPYPNISSNKIKARQTSNRNWYSWRTAVDVIQAYGRSIRSDEDWAHTYILDSSFGDLLKYNGNLFPKYFTEAIRLVK
jgi:Rad3-related DNA helicase